MVSPYCAMTKDFASKKARLLSKKPYIRITSNLPQTKRAILYLRSHFNYSINTLAQFLGRSASLIHRTLKLNQRLGALQFVSQRKLPNHVRLIAAQKHRLTIQRYMQLWTSFLLGEESDPPWFVKTDTGPYRHPVITKKKEREWYLIITILTI